MAGLEEHKTYLHEEFRPEVPIDGYGEDEKVILRKYGSWLKALMLREIEPVTDEQRYFLQMCYGETHPRSAIQRVWKKYQLDVMYKIAYKMATEIADNAFSYAQVVNYFVKLEQQGHHAAIEWLNMEGRVCNVPEDPPLVDIARIYLRRPGKLDIFDTGTIVSGSYGSSQR